MSQIPDFTETELCTLRTAFTERDGRAVDVQLGDSEVRLNPEPAILTSCPIAYWSMGTPTSLFLTSARANTAVSSTTTHATRTIPGAITTVSSASAPPLLLQVQADHERKQNLKTDKS